MAIVDDMICELHRRLVLESVELCLANDERTLTSRDFLTAVRLSLPGELARHAVSEGIKAVTKVRRTAAPHRIASRRALS